LSWRRFAWRQRLAGLLLGIVVVFAVNQARILLFYGYRASPAWFDALHTTITPIGGRRTEHGRCGAAAWRRGRRPDVLSLQTERRRPAPAVERCRR
jgi:hypothetical protein